MARERFIQSDLDEGRGVEGKRPRDEKARVREESGSPLEPVGRPDPEEKGPQEKGTTGQKEKKDKSFDRLSIHEKDDADIFR